MSTYNILETYKIKQNRVHVLKFTVPLSHTSANSQSIQVVATLCQKDNPNQTSILNNDCKVLAFIQGGPGFPCSPPAANSAYIDFFLDRGYSVLFMDQRGTGLSTPLNSSSFFKLVPYTEGETEQVYLKRQLEFILNFTGAAIVDDLEFIRKALLGDKKWSLHGQSFGGFCSFIYLSKYPKSIEAAFITGGVPPINKGPDDVYTATYQRAKDRNIHYYKKYPQDVGKVRTILTYLADNQVTLPDGGNLSVERFQQMGLNFGGFGGTDAIHTIVSYFHNDLELYNEPSRNTLSQVLNSMSFDTNVIYALFQESIYCDGNNPAVPTSNWSADRLRYSEGNEAFVFDKTQDTPVFFTTEMVYKSMYDDYEELRPFKKLAYALHSNTSWPVLYSKSVLEKITFEQVPIVGAVYVKDLYVDFGVTTSVIEEIFEGKNFRAFVVSDLFHDGSRQDPQRVFGNLIKLLDYEND